MAEEWRDGFPTLPGWYRCKVDDDVMWLKHFICTMTGRHEWADKSGQYVYEDVKWKGEPYGL